MSGPLQKSIVIAIDGGARTGATSVAKGLAETFANRYPTRMLSTGNVYRAIAYAFGLAHNFGSMLKDGYSEEQIVRYARNCHIRFDDEGRLTASNGHIFEQRDFDHVTRQASIIAAKPQVRELANQIVREYVERTVAVWFIEGRDVGSVVFPDASYKVFLTVDPEESVRRENMYRQEQGIATMITLEEVIERDERDRTRAVAPMVPAPDAEVFNTTIFNLEEVVGHVTDQVQPVLDKLA